ncbi:MAG: hypothetical protein ACI8WW_002802, partial [Oceanospirillaceae bacterium]
MRKLLFLLTFLPVTLFAQLLTDKPNNYTLDDSL